MPRGRAFPQLVLDILSLKARLELASAVTHPTARRPVLFALVRYAVIYQTRDPLKLVHQRAKMVCAMEKFVKAIVFEAHRLCRLAPLPAQAVLNADSPLNVLFVREVD